MKAIETNARNPRFYINIRYALSVITGLVLGAGWVLIAKYDPEFESKYTFISMAIFLALFSVVYNGILEGRKKYASDIEKTIKEEAHASIVWGFLSWLGGTVACLWIFC